MANEQTSASLIKNREVETNPCFFVSITRNQAEDILRRYSFQPGTYLLRWSSSYGKIAVSCVIAADTLDHALIFVSKKGQFYMEDGVSFAELQHLLDYYSQNGIPNFSAKKITVTLTHPVYRHRQKMPYPWQNEEIDYETVEDHKYAIIGQHTEKWQNTVKAILKGSPTGTPPRKEPNLDDSETNPKLLQINSEAETFVKLPKSLKQDSHYVGVGKTPKVMPVTRSPNVPPVPRRRTLDMLADQVTQVP